MSESRPGYQRPTNGRSQMSLLQDEPRGRRMRRSIPYDDDDEGEEGLLSTSSSRFRTRTPAYVEEARKQTTRKYMIAAFFLVVSLIAFVVQTETAVYIQHELKWNKPYCMLYLTHGSWTILWPAQIIILRFRKRDQSWSAFWRRHVHLVLSTGQMVESQQTRLSPTAALRSPVSYLARTTAYVASALTVAGCSWYIAVNLTTASDLTAIYNCSAFFAYAFSVPLLKEKLRLDKILAVLVAIVGVLIVAYAPSAKDGNASPGTDAASSRALGNIIIGIGSVLYGLYEVMYKRYACPPEGTSAGRGVIFANTFGSLIGLFTILVLWIPLPALHMLNIETFVWPTGETARMLAVSTASNAAFSGSFLVLISLTSPVLSSVASLLTIFLVALVDWKLHHVPLSNASITGGVLIILAFLILSWSTYRELDQEQEKTLEITGGQESDSSDN